MQLLSLHAGLPVLPKEGESSGVACEWAVTVRVRFYHAQACFDIVGASHESESAYTKNVQEPRVSTSTCCLKARDSSMAASIGAYRCISVR